MQISRPFREYHPAVKAAILMLPITLTVFLHDLVLKQPPDVRQILKAYYLHELSDFKKVLSFIIFSPILEELIYRGPAWIILFSSLLIAKKFNKQILKKVGYALTILTLIISTFIWSGYHQYPITVFGYGLVWGWLMIYTRNLCYPILFHSASNAIALMAIVIGHHLIY